MSNVNPYLSFMRFDDPDFAAAHAQKLQEAGISCKVEQEAPNVDPILRQQTIANRIHLLVHGEDFNKAHEIIETYYVQQLDDIDPDYYLLTFTEAELMEILRKPDEWGHFDYVLAQKLLKDRGYELTKEELTVMKEQRMDDLETPDDAKGFHATAPSVGPIASYIVATQKKTLPDGRQVYAYSKPTRNRAIMMAIVGGLLLLAALIRILASRN